MNLSKKTFSLVIISLAIGTLLGFTLSNYHYVPIPISELRSGGYSLINPLYDVDGPETAGAFSQLEKKIIDYVNVAISSENIDRVSVYFRNLNNGEWFGVNAKANFAPASLLKVPIMLAYFKKAEYNPAVLQKKLKLTTNLEAGVVPVFGPKNPIKIGDEYTVEQLIEKMIIESDNNALALLKQNISQEDIDKVSKDLGVPTSRSLNDFMSVKDYSSFFRVLFNSSYLDTTYSEKALSILAKSDFEQGIRNPLPKNILVADKFGERYINGATKYQLHDCGIIYYPKNPYLLCIMSEGKSYNYLGKTLQEISKIVYGDYSHIFPKQ